MDTNKHSTVPPEKGPDVDHEYKIEHDARCLGNPQHELKRGTKVKFDSFGYSHCPICNAQVKYTW